MMTAYDKRYQVFVSSTYSDLQAERHAVIMALLQLNAIPAGMELFPAANEDAWSLIKGVIDDCDYYILVVGGRYGSVDPIEDLSYTEKEYDYAVAHGKPVIAFLHGNPDAIPVGKAARSEQAQEKLIAFRRKVERSKSVKYWAGPEDLAGKVALSFSQLTRNSPAVGWVRANENASPEMLAEINDLRKRLAEMHQALDEARTSPPPGTEALAQGDEPFVTQLDYSISYHPRDAAFGTRVSGTIEINPTWDDIFGGLGPLMLDESAEDSLAGQIDSWAQEHYKADVLEDISGRIESQGHDIERVRLTDYEANMSWEAFHTVLVQLVALGLITQSERRRSVTDKGTYWALTPYGRTRLIQLRAIRREEASGMSSDSNSRPAE
jgi:predicted transcriptional regulator